MAATTTEIRWTEKKLHLLKTLVKLKAVNGPNAVTQEEIARASGGKALGNVQPHFDMTVQGYINWARLPEER